MGIVYLRTNLVNGMQYVGQTTNLPTRKWNWKNLNGPYSNKVIDRARVVYGLENFSFQILKECETREELNWWERYFIKRLNTRYPNGYNMCDGGPGCSGWIMPEAQKQKLKEDRSGEKSNFYGKLPWNALRKPPKSFGEAVSRGLKGKTKGRKKSEEHKRKIGLAHAIPVVQLTLDGEFVRFWESAAEAGRNGFNFSHICACCNGERQKHKGFRWMHREEYEKMLAEQPC